MQNIEKQIAQIHELKQNVSAAQSQVNKVDKDITDLKGKMNDYDTSIKHYSDTYDNVVRTTEENEAKMDFLYDKICSLEQSQKEIQSKQQNNEERMIDLQCRSMRENLIFIGISEPRLMRGEYEDVQATLKEFLRTEMNIDKDIVFDRVHRLGKFDRNQMYPRHVIAKFERFTDKEFVRQAAPRTLLGKPFGVREQFPPEIEEKRKLIYPEAKQAKLNRDNVVRLVKDKLYINGADVTAESLERSKVIQKQQQQMRPRQGGKSYPATQQQRQYHNATKERQSQNYRPQASAQQQERSERQFNIRARFHPQNRGQHRFNTPSNNFSRGRSQEQYSTVVSSNHFTPVNVCRNKQNQDLYTAEIPVSNSFNALRELSNEDSSLRFNSAGKTKASSPLDKDIEFKRQKEQSE
ncbi:MAG: hypothetical protein AB2784_08870, partial [Candidatus Thiodiazotropha endolucinida]